MANPKKEDEQKENSNTNKAAAAMGGVQKPGVGTTQNDNQNVEDGIEKANKFINKQSKIHQSKYTKLNYMTIPQLQAGKKILSDKLADPNVPAVTKTKLKDMYAEYEKSEAKINRYYRAIETNPLTRGFVRGQRDLLTIAQIRAQANRGVFDRDSNGFIKSKRAVADWMRAVNFDKIALGTGVALMGIGVMHIKFGEKTLAQMLSKMLGEFITKNPAAFGLLVSGASLIALSKIIPAIDRKHRKMVAHRAQVNAVFNDMAKAESANESNFDASKLTNPNMSDAEILELGSALCDNEELQKQYIAAVQDKNNILTRTQRLNILKVLQKSNALKKDLENEMSKNGMELKDNSNTKTNTNNSAPAEHQTTVQPAEQTTDKPAEQTTDKPVKQDESQTQDTTKPVKKTEAVKKFEENIKNLALKDSKKLQEAIQNDPNLSAEEKADLIQKAQQAAREKSEEMNATRFGISVDEYRKVKEQAKATGLTITKQIEANNTKLAEQHAK